MKPDTAKRMEELKAFLAENNERVESVYQQAIAMANDSPGDGWLCAQLGGIFDSNGFETRACEFYERALSSGTENFPPDLLPDFFLWYGSTLRNVGRIAESERQLRTALERWPHHSGLQFFRALSLFSLGRKTEAFVSLAELHAGHWDKSLESYKRAVESYLEEELRPLAEHQDEINPDCG